MGKKLSRSLAIVILILLAVAAVGYFFYKGNQQNYTVSETNVGSISAKPKALAGKETKYLKFSQDEYEKALKEKKIIFLDFYANWCPICRAEEPNLKAGFNSLKTDKIIGFRVNWGDSDTDEDEKKLAQEFGVVHQTAKIILKDGKPVFGPEIVDWDKDMLVKALTQYIQ